MKGLLVGVSVAGVAAVVAVTVVACSSGSHPTSNGGGAAVEMPGTGPGTGEDGGPGPGPGPGEDGGDGAVTGPKGNVVDNEDPEPTMALCGQNIVAFDLSALEPVEFEPTAAWVQARMAQTQPGLVLLLTNAQTGPVTASLGSVHKVSGVEYELDPAPSSAGALPVTLESQPFTFKVANAPATFAVSFSSAVVNGFSVAEVAVEGTTDAFCNQLTGLVTLTIPATDANKAAGFGSGTTVGQVFGAPTHTIGSDTTPNAWKMTLNGTATNVSLRTD